MRLLLDSHAFLWFCEGNVSLTGSARAAIEDVGNEKYVSHATAWEVAIKASLGRLRLAIPYDELFPTRSCRMVLKRCRPTSDTTENCWRSRSTIAILLTACSSRKRGWRG